MGLLIISQLHFLAIMATSLIFFIFFIFQKGWKDLKPKYYVYALGLILFFHIPMITSDINNDGENIRRMIAGIFQQNSEYSFKENFIETVKKSSEFYLYFPLSISDDEIPQIKIISVFYLGLSLLLVGLIFQNKIEIPLI